MSMMHRTATLVVLAAGCAGLALVTPRAAVGQSVKQQSAQVTRSDIADQLGTKIVSGQGEEMGIGSSMTGTLVNAARLAKLGIAGMHEGARVSVMRVAPDKLRVEVDEMDPTPQTKKVTLWIDEKGHLVTSAP